MEARNVTKKTTYKPAREIAHSIEKHFQLHQQEAVKRGEAVEAEFPKADLIAEIVDVAFWASLLKEEGHSPKLSLVFLDPQQAESPLMLAHPLAFHSHVLIKVAAGFALPGVHLGVWHEQGDLYIWGATNRIPAYSFVLNVPEPGLLVIKHRREEEFSKFTNIAVLNGDEIKIVDEKTAFLPDCPSLLGVPSSNITLKSTNMLVSLAVSMRAHGKGGALLVVPAKTDKWKESIRQPMHYELRPAFSSLAELLRQEKRGLELWPTSLKRAVDEIGGLTAIDGAVVMNDDYEVMAFGAKIMRSGQNGVVEQMLMTEPVEGNKGRIVDPGQNGGTRHLSAAQFVHDQRDAFAMIASQDGRFTVFSWSHEKQIVQAHRIEVLLL